MLRILIADDHPIMRHGLRLLVEETGRMEVVAEARDGDAAVDHLARVRPDLALLDLAMPRRDGLKVAEWARDNAPEVRLVILTMYDEASYLERALSLGVSGYLLKEDANDELVRCLDHVASGKVYVSPSVGGGRKAEVPASAADASALARLTPTQRAILRHVADYKTSKEIARDLGVSYRTVQNHRTNMARELELSGRNALLAFARRHRDRL